MLNNAVWGGVGCYSRKFKYKCHISVALCITLSTSLYAKHELNDDEVYEISDVSIDANATKVQNNTKTGVLTKVDSFGGTRTVTRELIEATPSGNGDITSLLKSNPAVKFSSSNRQSTTMGEIDPADISINGAKSYQNNFQIDGININNDLNPNSGNNADTRYNANSALEVSTTASQGVNIDSDFIESIDVYDSNISAKYGSFTGGVIDAKTRNPREGFHGKFSISHTNDSWVKYKISEDELEDFENSSSEKMQPKFEKWTTRLNLEGFLTDDFGLMFGYTDNKSKIPLNAFSFNGNGNYANEKVNQRRRNQNYFLKGVWYATDRLTLTPSLIYAPATAKIHYNGALNSMQEVKSGGLTLGLNMEYEADFAKIFQKFSYSKLQSSRDAKHEYRRTWSYSNAKNWRKNGSNVEGGYGDIKQIQKTFRYNFDVDFDSFNTFSIKHDVRMGLEFSNQHASYEIISPFTQGTSYRKNSVTCANGDIFCDDSGLIFPVANAGWSQYMRQLYIFNKGKIQASQKSHSFYLEDSIKYKNLTLRTGVRFDGDDYMDKKTVSPRFSASYDVFDSGNTVLNFGKNRYYGRNLFAYKLNDGKESLRHTYRLNPYTTYNQNWTYYAGNKNLTKFSQLDIPYDDETSFGLKQHIGPISVNTKYIERKGRKQIVQVYASTLGIDCGDGYAPGTSQCRLYTNDGWSDNKIFSLSISNIEPIKFLNTSHNIELGYSKQKSKTNNSTYTSVNTDDFEDAIVYYDDNLMRRSSLPVANFYTPWTASATLVSHVPQLNLTLSNFVHYKSSKEALRTAKK
ncbi:TonB-dependent receptor plug domain-containing protein [Campylobacter majalis]|uniref:TonB-dependent receptor plug domain-containing protein n=1 Tax=Campylobacter majalis TaxID=2790656 RepID=UPI003D6890ED